jgi:hypothetical protein
MLYGKVLPRQILLELHTHEAGRMRDVVDLFLALDKAGYRCVRVNRRQRITFVCAFVRA